MRRFLECLIPVTACNLKCSYCYVIQEGRRKNEKAVFAYSPEYIGQALSVKRLGGVSLVSITGSGETMMPIELPAITREILKQGHFVNITTNGTLTKPMKLLLEETEGFHSHLHFSFSFHYIELKKKNLINVFFSNVRLAKQSGCSILLQINLADEYFDCWDEIKKLSLENVGALPQVALTRDESNGEYKILTNHSVSEYIAKAREMKSPLFEYTLKNFNQKRYEFCHAGLWSAKLNLATGEMTGCYGNGYRQNIFKDLTKDIVWLPIGNNCCFKYCFNSSHFLSQGNIPSFSPDVSYGSLRNRKEAQWYSAEMQDFLYSHFYDVNHPLKEIDYKKYNNKYKFLMLKYKWVSKIKHKLFNFFRNSEKK